MNIAMLLQMAADGLGDRIAVGSRDTGLTYQRLFDDARRTATWLRDQPVTNLVLVDVNSAAVPVVLFGAALAGRAFVPVNFRLADDRLRAIIARTTPAAVLTGPTMPTDLGSAPGLSVTSRGDLLDLLPRTDPDLIDAGALEAENVAVLLFTSGTTGEPKAAVLRHQNLFSYIVETVEFMSADDDECALVSVPAYHIAGISAVLSSVFAGRRLVYLEQFDPEEWVRLARAEHVTHAMVVPTMLVRILDVLDRDGGGLPSLRHLSYGGGPMPLAVIERALGVLGDVEFVNAYGLTETSSTISVLSPDDHRTAFASTEPAVRQRLGSVGRPSPSIELEIRDANEIRVDPGTLGEIWVRGSQVSGEYLGSGTRLRDGWFPTRDAGRLDEHGYLYVAGRLDDTIVRGGENIAPAEIEEVLLEHPAIESAAVFGVPDTEWGEAIAVVVVAAAGRDLAESDVRDWVRARLRSSRVPQVIQFRSTLPFNETGKLLRRTLRDEVSADRRS